MSVGFYPDTPPNTGIVRAMPPAPTMIAKGAATFKSSLLLGIFNSVTVNPSVANTLYPVLSITGAGMIPFFCTQSGYIPSPVHRVKITIDGNVVYDASSTSVGDTGYGLLAIGNYQYISASSVGAILTPTYFNKELRIEVASATVPETLYCKYVYEVY